MCHVVYYGRVKSMKSSIYVTNYYTPFMSIIYTIATQKFLQTVPNTQNYMHGMFITLQSVPHWRAYQEDQSQLLWKWRIPQTVYQENTLSFSTQILQIKKVLTLKRLLSHTLWCDAISNLYSTHFDSCLRQKWRGLEWVNIGDRMSAARQ